MVAPARFAFAIAVLALPTLSAAAANTVRSEAAGLRFSVPARWVRVPGTETERAAQWRLPRAGGDAHDAELVLYFFGKGMRRSADESVARWQAAFFQPDGRASRDASTVTVRTVRGLRVTSLDVAGTYKPGPTRDGPMPPPRRGQRMLAAAIEGDDGPWFLEAIGPAATIAATKPEFDEMLDSLAPHR